MGGKLKIMGLILGEGEEIDLGEVDFPKKKEGQKELGEVPEYLRPLIARVLHITGQVTPGSTGDGLCSGVLCFFGRDKCEKHKAYRELRALAGIGSRLVIFELKNLFGLLADPDVRLYITKGWKVVQDHRDHRGEGAEKIFSSLTEALGGRGAVIEVIEIGYTDRESSSRRESLDDLFSRFFQ